MMELPSESHSALSQYIIPILTTLGAGGLIKLYAQWQAGRTSVRAELQTRIRSLEESQFTMLTQIGDLREQNGRQQATIDALRDQNKFQQMTIDGLRNEINTLRSMPGK